MSDDPVVPSTKITRLPDKSVTDLDELHELLDSVLVAHVGLVVDGHPVVLPTAVVRDGDHLVIHGSTGSPWMRTLTTGAAACVTVTALDAIVVARSAFESSMRYRSAMIFGTFRRVPDEQLETMLDRVVERLIPGRLAEVRRHTTRELAATLLLSMPIETWSMKASDGWPEDEPSDIAGNAWAGVVPIEASYAVPMPAPDLRDGIEVPESVRAMR